MIVIPMAGLSSRFFKAGYELPKYQLELPNGQTVFEWAVTSFEHYFQTEKFVFIVRDVYNTPEFVRQQILKMNIKDAEVVILNRETVGQAETVSMGLEALTNLDIQDECYIFNIDSRRHNFEKPNVSSRSDAYLEVFEGEGEHWSFIEVNSENKVIRTTEKVRISNLCSDGLYFFKHISVFLELVKTALVQQDFVKGELYIAPLYNKMIQTNQVVGYELIQENQISFCGTPDEYQDIYQKMAEAEA